MIDGKPVQQFLQDTYISAMMVIANAMKDEPNVVGFDTLNEPNHGWVGRKVSGQNALPLPTHPNNPRI